MSESGKKALGVEVDEHGEEFLKDEKWQKMGTRTFSERAAEQVEEMVGRVRSSIEGEDFLRVLWLSSALFFLSLEATGSSDR